MSGFDWVKHLVDHYVLDLVLGLLHEFVGSSKPGGVT